MPDPIKASDALAAAAAPAVVRRTLSWTAVLLAAPVAVVGTWASVVILSVPPDPSGSPVPRAVPGVSAAQPTSQPAAERAPAPRDAGPTRPLAPVAPPAGQPAPAPADAGPRAGLELSLAPAGAAAATPDVRAARLLALTVPAGEAFSARFPPSPFTARFRGEVTVDVRERYVFTFEGRGALELEVNGKTVLRGDAHDGAPVASEPVRLKKGANTLAARYLSPASGEARLRVLWSTSEFAPEPVPPDALAHVPTEGDGGAAAARAAVLRLQCTACHRAPEAAAATAPDLREAGARLQPGWLVAWLLDPVRSGEAPRQMPHFFAADGDGPQQAADVAAYLATLGAAEPARERSGDAGAGGALFAQLGCIGCHRRPGSEPAAAADDRLDLSHTGAKWRPGALAAFLRAPQQHDPGASMPDFRLSEREAADLEAFVAAASSPAAVPPPGDAGRGRTLVGSLGCAACHALPEGGAPAAPAWEAVAARVGSGDPCRGPAAYPSAPRGVSWPAALVGRLPVAVEAEELVASRRCTACHARDGVVDRWTRHAGEVADLLPAPATPDANHPEVAQSRPALTWAGEKLTTAALHAVVAGEATARARPWLHARMPGFPADAAVLATGLACGHGMPAPAADPPAPDPAAVAIGQDLVSPTRFACVTCHGVGEQPPLQVFEVQGVNFVASARRLRPDFFLRWMRSPQRVDPGSKMPSYADARGKTAFTEVLGGDADRQFGAIWAWMRNLR